MLDPLHICTRITSNMALAAGTASRARMPPSALSTSSPSRSSCIISRMAGAEEAHLLIIITTTAGLTRYIRTAAPAVRT